MLFRNFLTNLPIEYSSLGIRITNDSKFGLGAKHTDTEFRQS